MVGKKGTGKERDGPYESLHIWMTRKRGREVEEGGKEDSSLSSALVLFYRCR
jgi:hypothetical protein